MRRSQSQRAAVNDLELKMKNQIDPHLTKEMGASSNKPVARSNKTLDEKSKTPVANSKSNEPTIVAKTTSGEGAIPKHRKKGQRAKQIQRNP